MGTSQARQTKRSLPSDSGVRSYATCIAGPSVAATLGEMPITSSVAREIANSSRFIHKTTPSFQVGVKSTRGRWRRPGKIIAKFACQLNGCSISGSLNAVNGLAHDRLIVNLGRTGCRCINLACLEKPSPAARRMFG